MKRLIYLFLFFPLLLNAQDLTLAELKNNFMEPGPAWRGKPFWSWNGDLEKEELIRQIHVMKEMGMGGFFMHSRTGLKTEYLGDEWFELINACADEAEKLDMEAWLYDEDRWPSGLAGGLVTKYPQYRAQLMTMHVFAPGAYKPDRDYDALFSCRLEGNDCYEVKKVSTEAARKENKDRTLLAFFMREDDKSTFYNGFTDVDRLNREATDYFFQTTHEEYLKRCGDRMGTSIYGIFTDEPNRRGSLRNNVGLDRSLENRIFLPWTGKFAEEYQQRMGEDIMDKLPELFLQPEGALVSPVKWQYLEVVQQLFLENWIIPYYEWCENNNIKFTGHFLHENNLTSQTAVHGSLMRAYEYMHYPGIDVLTEFANLPWIAKQCQSVARQMGQPFILSELYGVTGWQFDFAGHKYVGDWQALFGVNLRCHHLSWYTMGGQAKRDYPASILHQSTWYKDYNYVETYFARLGYMLGQGEADCNVLVLNPVESVWSRLRLGWANGLSPHAPDIKDLENHYAELFYALQGNQIDFDYGDEGILLRHGKVVQASGNKAGIQIGEAKYTTLVIGKMTTMRSSTLKLLKEFYAAGGTIILAGDPPTHLDAIPSDVPANLSERVITVPFDKEKIAEAVRKHTPVPVEAIHPGTGKPLEDVYCQVKRDGERTILVAMNMSREKSYPEVLLRIHASGYVCEWDCESGRIVAVEAAPRGSMLEITASFAGPEEHVYTITPTKLPEAEKEQKWEVLKRVPLNGPFAYSLDEPNVCVLDMGYVEIDGDRSNELTEILKIDQKIRDHYELPQRAGNMVQPWFKKKFYDAPEVQGQVKIHFPFFVEELPGNDLAFCMETPGAFSISINGVSIDPKEDGWWVDKAIRRFSLPANLLKQGENILVQTFDFRDDLDIESLYLLGNFSVSLEGSKKTLGLLPETIEVGDLAKQGFPFYSGRVKYVLPLKEDYSQYWKVDLEVSDYSAACLIADPDGADPGIIAWQPNRVDLSGSLEGEFELILECVLTRRNSFGPLHHTPLNNTTGPRHFLTTGKQFTKDYMLYPSGILEAPQLVLYK